MNLLQIVGILTSLSYPLFVHSTPLSFEEENGLFQYLVNTCHVNRGFYDSQVDIATSMYIYKLVEFDEQNEAMTIFATFTLKWHSECILWEKNATKLGITHVSFPANLWWRPKILHISAVDDVQAVAINGDNLNMNFFPNGWIEWSPTGPWKTRCELTLLKFPFDTQTCYFAFELWDTEAFTNLTSSFAMTDIQHPDKVTSDMLIWQIESVNSRLEPVCFPMSTPPKIFCASQVIFSITVKRKAEPYIFSIFLPTIALSILQLSPLAIPPQFPERATYSVTVLLAFAVINQLIQSAIPQTAEIVYLVIYVGFTVIIGTICTLYSVFSIILWEKSGETRKISIYGRQLSLVTFLDVTFLSVCIIVLIIVNIVFFILFKT